MTTVPEKVKKSSIAKWSKPATMNEDQLIEWWVKEGSLPCAFCDYFGEKQITYATYRCNLCPLYTGTGVCAPEWNALNTHLTNVEEEYARINPAWVKGMCTRLLHRIENIPEEH